MIYAVSDTHLGMGNGRDNCTSRTALEALFTEARSQDALFIMVGDILETWQYPACGVLEYNKTLLERFLQYSGTRLILGNHDSHLVGHPFFDHPQCHSHFDAWQGGQWFRFNHGHEWDDVNNSPRPGIAQVLTILAGMAEDAGWLMRLSRWWHNLKVSPRGSYRAGQIREHIIDETTGHIVCGHTHEAGSWGEYHNTGCWVDGRTDYLIIDDANGGVSHHSY